MSVMDSTLNHVKETFGTVKDTFDLSTKDGISSYLGN